jgi:pectin methylesterase-like acyl-CoA thioesterase
MAKRTLFPSLGTLILACASPSDPAAQTNGPTPTAASPPASVPETIATPPWWSGLWPEPGAPDTCLDPILTIRSLQAVRVGTAGALRVFDSVDPLNPVYVLDLALPPFQRSIAGHDYYVPHPVVSDGVNVRIALGSGILEPERSYFVSVDAGVFVDDAGNPLGGLPGDAWSFTTGPLPAPVDAHFTVRADGSGTTCTIQGALDVAPKDAPVVIDLGAGTYPEILRVTGFTSLTLRGEGAEVTSIAHTNNDTLQRGGGTASRSLVTVESSQKFVLEGLTLHNTTPEGGSQAEALGVQAGVRTVVRNAVLRSTQDTVMMNGRAYVESTTLFGNVDYVWGTGAAYFLGSELRTVGRAGYTVQARNLPTSPGFVFVDSRLTAEEGISGHYLARIEVDRFPSSRVAFVDCELGSHIAPVGWLTTPSDDPGLDLRFEEYGSRDAAGDAIDTSGRHPASRQLTREEAEALRDPVAVLGWDPNE